MSSLSKRQGYDKAGTLFVVNNEPRFRVPLLDVWNDYEQRYDSSSVFVPNGELVMIVGRSKVRYHEIYVHVLSSRGIGWVWFAALDDVD